MALLYKKLKEKAEDVLKKTKKLNELCANNLIKARTEDSKSIQSIKCSLTHQTEFISAVSKFLNSTNPNRSLLKQIADVNFEKRPIDDMVNIIEKFNSINTELQAKN